MRDNTITRAMTRCGSARIIIINSKAMVNDAIKIHNLSPTAAAALGRTLTATSMAGILLKDKEDTVTVSFNGDGVCGKILAVADYYGNTKGFVQRPQADLPLNSRGKLDVAGAVGKGTMSVVKDMGQGEPFVGLVPIVSGEIAEDFTNYYATSEQTPTVCALGVRVDKENMAYAAGGYLVQLMPGYEDEVVDRLEANITVMESVSKLIADGKDGDEIISIILDGIEFEMFDEFDIEYRCTCAREKYLRALVGLSEDDMNELKKSDEPVETNCRFCGKKYVFELDELDRAREEARKISAETEDESEDAE